MRGIATGPEPDSGISARFPSPRPSPGGRGGLFRVPPGICKSQVAIEPHPRPSVRFAIRSRRDRSVHWQGGLRMGKETKIGLAVLAVLLLVFAVVLGRRLTRPSAETAEATPPGQEKAPIQRRSPRPRTPNRRLRASPPRRPRCSRPPRCPPARRSGRRMTPRPRGPRPATRRRRVFHQKGTVSDQPSVGARSDKNGTVPSEPNRRIGPDAVRSRRAHSRFARRRSLRSRQRRRNDAAGRAAAGRIDRAGRPRGRRLANRRQGAFRSFP